MPLKNKKDGPTTPFLITFFTEIGENGVVWISYLKKKKHRRKLLPSLAEILEILSKEYFVKFQDFIKYRQFIQVD
jgi:hypothetical protein